MRRAAVVRRVTCDQATRSQLAPDRHWPCVDRAAKWERRCPARFPAHRCCRSSSLIADRSPAREARATASKRLWPGPARHRDAFETRAPRVAFATPFRKHLSRTPNCLSLQRMCLALGPSAPSHSKSRQTARTASASIFFCSNSSLISNGENIQGDQRAATTRR